MNIVALGFNVKQLVHWVAAGEADGSIVWNTDVNNIKGIKVIPIKDFFKFRSNVPVCNLNTKSHRVNKFISYLRTDGKGFFKKHGFRVNL